MPRGHYDRTKPTTTKTAGGAQELQALARKLDAVDRKITTALASLKPLADERQQLRQQIDAALKAGDRAITGATIPNGAIDRPPAPEPTPLPTTGAGWSAARLRRMMALLDIDAEELAKRAGVTTATVRDWTTGAQDVDRAPLSVLNKLSALEAQTRGVTA
jgi:DNA-binding Xre family transcriptional regulator